DDAAVASAEMSVDSGVWLSMGATDGAFGDPSEGLTGSIGGSVLQIAAGDAQTCALLADTTVHCWGLGGELGDGTTTGKLTPVAVAGLSGVRAIAAFAGHTCALLADTTVRCWGYNGYGELGDGTGADSLNPVTVIAAAGNTGALSGVTAISLSNAHTCALLADTTVRCWGVNSQGQLGDGT